LPNSTEEIPRLDWPTKNRARNHVVSDSLLRCMMVPAKAVAIENVT